MYTEQLTEEFLSAPAAQKLKEQIRQQTEHEIIEKMDEISRKSESQLKLVSGPYRYADVRITRLLRQFAAQFVRRSKNISDEGYAELQKRLSSFLTDDFPFDGILEPLFRNLPEKTAAPSIVSGSSASGKLVVKPVSAKSHSAAIQPAAAERMSVSKDFTMMSALAERNGRILAFGPEGTVRQSAMIVQRDGSVFAVNTEQNVLTDYKELKNWKSIKEITSGGNAVAGLHYNGKVEMIGLPPMRKEAQSWPAMQMIKFSNDYLLGITATGKMKTTFPVRLPGLLPTQSPVSVLTVADGYLVLLWDGTVLGEAKFGCKEWTQMIGIAAGTSHFLGLSREGKVVAAGSNSEGQCETLKWNNIIAVAADGNVSAGLNSGGSLVTTDPELTAKVAGWHEIAGFTLRNRQILAVTNSGKVLSSCIPASKFAGCQPNFITIPR